MKKSTALTTFAAIAASTTLALSGCSPSSDSSSEDHGSAHASHEATQSQPPADESEGHAHAADGGDPPAGITVKSDPRFALGDDVTLTADHMPGMDGAAATISGAFDTTTYSVSYTPTDGGKPVKAHKWVVHEELENPGKAPLKNGTEVTLNSDHMPGMKGAEATIDNSTEQTVYMVDLEMDDMSMTNHKWVVEDEIRPAD